MERVVYKIVTFVVALFLLPVSVGWAQEAQPTDRGGTVLQEQLSITDGQTELEGTREYVAPESSPFADTRFEALELRVQRLEEALSIAAERLQTEKERRQRLEDLLKAAGVIK